MSDITTDRVDATTGTNLADREVLIAGCTCIIRPKRTTYFGDQLLIPEGDALGVLGALCAGDPILDTNIGIYCLVDEAGNTIKQSYSMYGLKFEIEMAERRRRQAEVDALYNERLKAIRDRVHALRKHGVIIEGSDLESSIRQVAVMTRYNLMHYHQNGQLESTIRHIEKELDRLEETSPREVFLTGMVSGTLRHRWSLHNDEVIAAVLALSIRSGGFIEPITTETLRAFYLEVLEAAPSDAVLRDLNFRLSLEDYAPAEIVNDPELELAPTEVTLPGIKGRETTYGIEYQMVSRDGRNVPAGVLSVPLTVYNRLAPEHGKRSGFPELPHGIELFLRVTCSDKVLVEGFNTLDFASKVTKAQRGKNRSKHADNLSVVGDSGEVPPWYQGKTKPGRRR